jgi:molecular chaperone DnaJ
LTISVQKHELFERHGNDLFLVVPIAIHEAALGSKIEIPTFDGPGRVRIPPGTQSGQRLRLRGRGVPSLGSGPQGDLIVEIRLVLPRLADERSKELLQEFGKLNPENVRKELDKLS